jgi:hypothetical protein
MVVVLDFLILLTLSVNIKLISTRKQTRKAQQRLTYEVLFLKLKQIKFTFFDNVRIFHGYGV